MDPSVAMKDTKHTVHTIATWTPSVKVLNNEKKEKDEDRRDIDIDNDPLFEGVMGQQHEGTTRSPRKDSPGLPLRQRRLPASFWQEPDVPRVNRDAVKFHHGRLLSMGAHLNNHFAPNVPYIDCVSPHAYPGALMVSSASRQPRLPHRFHHTWPPFNMEAAHARLNAEFLKMRSSLPYGLNDSGLLSPAKPLPLHLPPPPIAGSGIWKPVPTKSFYHQRFHPFPGVH